MQVLVARSEKFKCSTNMTPGEEILLAFLSFALHPGKSKWNLKFTQLKRKIIFQTSTVGFYVNIPECK